MTDDPPDHPKVVPLRPEGATTEHVEDILRTDSKGRFIRGDARLKGATEPVMLVFDDHTFTGVAKLPDRDRMRSAEYDERMCLNEAAVYALARHLGIELVPVTIVRYFPRSGGGRALCSVQLFDGDALKPVGPEELETVDVSTLRVAAAFDHAVAQVDRIGKNWLLVPNDDGTCRLRLIDHGLCFNVEYWAPLVGATGQIDPGFTLGDGAHSDIIDFVEAKGLTPDWTVLEPLLDTDLDAIVGSYLMPAQVEQLRRRIGELLSDEQIG